MARHWTGDAPEETIDRGSQESVNDLIHKSSGDLKAMAVIADEIDRVENSSGQSVVMPS